jgi:HEAT repeat protein
MPNTNLERVTLLSAGAALATTAQPALAAAVDELLANIKSKDEQVRTQAWRSAGPAGAPALKPLAATMQDPELEVARAAKRAMFQIVRHAGRPGAAQEKAAVVPALVSLLADSQPVAVRREVLWMISEIGGDEAVDAVAALLKQEELREDARLVLQRIPGDRSLAALQAGMQVVPEAFKFHLAASLRLRGVTVEGHPDQKLVPTKKTDVQPVGR